jgi:UDP-N-acetylmuramoyl-L-alanyl-D-glutamate--2,6-diaminopimelate ligase
LRIASGRKLTCRSEVKMIKPNAKAEVPVTGMILQTLLKALDIPLTGDEQDLDITGLSYHSERVAPGDLFVCIKGYKTDGHRYLKQAAAKGAVAAVVEEVRPAVPIAQYRVANSRQALAALADLFYNHPSQKVKVIGVTATNGKTTTTFMTDAILEEHGLKTGLIGTVIVKVGNTVRPAVLTTPESLDLHHLFRQMVDHGISHVTMEASSSGLELYRVGNVAFDIVAVNNISREHIDLHGSFEAYFNAKARLVREADPEQWAIFNLDCPNSASLAGQTRAKTLTYGLKNGDADCLVKNLDLSTGRARFAVELQKTDLAGPLGVPGRSFPIELSVLGLHSVYNAMVAVLAGLLCGVPVQTIQRALRNFRGVERRFELIFEDEFKVIDDHFANSGNIDVTLETLKYMDYRSLHVVYAIRGSRGVTVNRESAQALARWAPVLGVKEIIATTSISHVTDKDLVTDEEAAEFRAVMDHAGLKTVICDELPDAVARGLARTRPGDILLLAGCQGMDHGARTCLEQIHRRHPHLGREKVFEALQNRVAGM